MYSIFRQSQLFDVPVVQPLAVPKFGDERGVRHHEDVLLVHNAVLHASLHDIALTTQLVSMPKLQFMVILQISTAIGILSNHLTQRLGTSALSFLSLITWASGAS